MVDCPHLTSVAVGPRDERHDFYFLVRRFPPGLEEYQSIQSVGRVAMESAGGNVVGGETATEDAGAENGAF